VSQRLYPFVDVAVHCATPCTAHGIHTPPPAKPQPSRSVLI